MASGSQLKAWLTAYIDALGRGDVDAIVGQYGPDATCEDPVGGPVHRGRQEIRAFYEKALSGGPISIELLSPIATTSSNEAAVAARAMTRVGLIYFVETQAYDTDGQITKMRAYYDPADLAGPAV